MGGDQVGLRNAKVSDSAAKSGRRRVERKMVGRSQAEPAPSADYRCGGESGAWYIHVARRSCRAKVGTSHRMKGKMLSTCGER